MLERLVRENRTGQVNWLNNKSLIFVLWTRWVEFNCLRSVIWSQRSQGQPLKCAEGLRHSLLNKPKRCISRLLLNLFICPQGRSTTKEQWLRLFLTKTKYKRVPPHVLLNRSFKIGSNILHWSKLLKVTNLHDDHASFDPAFHYRLIGKFRFQVNYVCKQLKLDQLLRLFYSCQLIDMYR